MTLLGTNEESFNSIDLETALGSLNIGSKQTDLFTRLTALQQQLMQTKLLVQGADDSLTSRRPETVGK